jgi:drug/metabolite transporter (DMT)-like permease
MNTGATPAGKSFLGVAALLFCTLLWGTTFIVVQRSQESASPEVLMLGRFFVAAMLFLPIMRTAWIHWRPGLELGGFLWAGYFTQAIGLQYTSVPRVAFINATFVVLVPMLAIVAGKKVRGLVWIAAFIALAGTLMLSHDGAAPNRGDLWSVVTAFLWALYIHRLGVWAEKVPSFALAAVHLWGVVLFSGAFLAIHHPHIEKIPWAGILYLGVAGTAMTVYLQSYGQKTVSAPQAAVLFMLEPVFASLIAVEFQGTRLSVAGWTGAALILAGALLSQLPENSPPIQTPV